jgi:hypothetical protein
MRRIIHPAVGWSVALGAAGTLAVAAPAAYADDTPTTTSDACAPLPAWVQGQPGQLHAGAPSGDYLWHDKDGWHLRVTHGNKHKQVFAGQIKASRPITFVKVKDEARDKATLSSDKQTLTFRFVNYGGIDGVDFTDACAQTTKFAFAIDGDKAGRNRIYVGKHSARPSGDPFTIHRRTATQTA